MKAICVDANRNLELREVPAPEAPPPGYVVVHVIAAAINHGDKTFLKMPDAAGGTPGTRMLDIWGASASGVVVAAGAGVPAGLVGRTVAIYRSLQPDKPIAGLWCERALVPWLACLPLPDGVEAVDYSGSLVNIVTAYAFLQMVRSQGHRGLIATAGNSATGRALTALTRDDDFPAIFLTRTEAGAAELRSHGVPHVLAADAPGFAQELASLAAALGTTAVFEGIGGGFASGLAGVLPNGTTMYFYGFLAGADPVSLPSAMFMAKDLTMKRFSNFDNDTVRDETKLHAVLTDLAGRAADPLFRTKVGAMFALDAHVAAMAFEGAGGAKAVFMP